MAAHMERAIFIAVFVISLAAPIQPSFDSDKEQKCGIKPDVGLEHLEHDLLNQNKGKAESSSGILSGRIMGGRESVPHSWPWMAVIVGSRTDHRQRAYVYKRRFSGTVINQRYILTAAHCFGGDPQYLNPRNHIVVLGVHQFSYNVDDTEGEEYKVEAIIRHDEYVTKPYLRNDIALVRLEKDIIYGPKISPICLMPAATPEEKRDLTNIKGVVAGWGFVNGTTNSDVLREVVVPVVSSDECFKWYAPSPERVCAGYTKEKKDACSGDSGGPLMYSFDKGKHWTQIGVISAGNKCGTVPGYPGVYIRTDVMREWIDEHSKI